jgi:hypothetical protein
MYYVIITQNAQESEVNRLNRPKDLSVSLRKTEKYTGRSEQSFTGLGTEDGVHLEDCMQTCTFSKWWGIN